MNGNTVGTYSSTVLQDTYVGLDLREKSRKACKREVRKLLWLRTHVLASPELRVIQYQRVLMDRIQCTLNKIVGATEVRIRRPFVMIEQ